MEPYEKSWGKKELAEFKDLAKILVWLEWNETKNFSGISGLGQLQCLLSILHITIFRALFSILLTAIREITEKYNLDSATPLCVSLLSAG